MQNLYNNKRPERDQARQFIVGDVKLPKDSNS